MGRGPGESAAGQGVVWFVDDGNKQLVEYNIAANTATYFDFPSGTSEVEGLTLAKDGTLWFTEGTTGRTGQLNPATAAISEYSTSPASSSSTGITQGPDGNIWFADNSGNDVYTVQTNGTTYTPVAGGTCTTRQYGFDGDTNRTSLTTITSTNATCNTTGGTTQNYSYDTADRLTSSGGNSPTYDPFGRITSLPANLADPTGQTALTAAFYVNDRAQQLAQGNTTIDYSSTRRYEFCNGRRRSAASRRIRTATTTVTVTSRHGRRTSQARGSRLRTPQSVTSSA